jgi:hypothetical protein
MFGCLSLSYWIIWVLYILDNLLKLIEAQFPCIKIILGFNWLCHPEEDGGDRFTVFKTVPGIHEELINYYYINYYKTYVGYN